MDCVRLHTYISDHRACLKVSLSPVANLELFPSTGAIHDSPKLLLHS